MYEELNSMYPSHYHFYSVSLPDMNDALEKCARLCHGDVFVTNYKGQMILTSQHPLPHTTIEWANPVPGSPELTWSEPPAEVVEATEVTEETP